MSIKIITDSTSNLTFEQAAKFDIDIIPAFVIIDDEEILDDGSIPPLEFYDKIDKSKRSMTSLSSPQSIWDAIDKNKDYENILMIHVGNKLSGYIGAVTSVVKQYQNKNDKSPEITIYDSNGVSLLVGYLAIRAKQLIDEGLGIKKIIKKLDSFRDNDLKVYVTVSSLKKIFEGGRIKRTKYMLAEFLNALPILSIDDGLLKPIGKEFGFDRTIRKIIELFQNHYKRKDEVHVSFGITRPNKKSDIFRKMIEKLESPNITEIHDFYIGNIITCHTGTEVYGIVTARNFKLN